MQRRTLAITAQLAGTGLVVGTLVAAGMTASDRLSAQGAGFGLDVLFQQTGWTISSPVLDQSANDPYWWTMLVGLANTAFIGALAIIGSTVLGFFVGLGRLSANHAIAKACRLYVDTFRNVPLILQALFWYAAMSQPPRPVESFVFRPMSRGGRF